MEKGEEILQIFKNRPLATSICVFAITALLAIQFSSTVKLFLCLLFLAALAISVAVSVLKKSCGKHLTSAILCFGMASFALFQSWYHFDVLMMHFAEKEGQTVTVEGYVTERLDAGTQNGRFAVRLSELDGQHVSSKILLECRYTSSLQRGDRFRLIGTVRSPIQSELYPEDTVLSSDGYLGILTCENHSDCTILEASVITPKLKLLELRDHLSERFRFSMERESGALASALFLGDRSYLSGDTVLTFQRGGISHLLALSGMHISIIILLWEFFLRKCRIPKLFRAVIVPAIAVFYLLLTGCSPSTFRAVLMLCILYLSYLFHSDYDPFTSLCAALFLILTISPYAVTDVSMWMSFVASAGIVIFVPAVSQWMDTVSKNICIPKWVSKCVTGVVTAVTVGLFANAAILPLSAYFFGSTSLFSVGLTLLLSPIMSICLILSAICLLLPWFAPVPLVTQSVLGFLLLIAERVSNLPNAVVLLNGAVTVCLISVLTVSLIVCAIFYLKKKGWLLFPIGLSFVILGVAFTDVLPSDAGVAVTYLRNEYEEVLVIAEGRNAIAIDASHGSSVITARMKQAVFELKCTELQELILTHYHPQSTRLIASLSSSIKIRALRLPKPNCGKEKEIAKRLEQEAELHGISIRYGMDELPIQSMEIQMWERTATDTAIEVPVLLSVTVRQHRLVYLSGNAWNCPWQDLAESAAFSSDYLILGAHGTESAPSKTFFAGLGNVKSILFGNEKLFAAYPADRLPSEYCTEVEYKKFFLK